jgi:glycosyltransferase involved in cell wall biosynthesis
MHNFIDLTDTNDGLKKDYVLYFGRYSPEKGISTLLKAAKELPDIKFVFAGGGPLEEELSSIPNIENVGFKTGDDLARLICEARFSVYPSEWYENCPFSVMESQMYSTPVIGAKIGGIPELISDFKTGELFESGNCSELKDKIFSLWNDRKRLEEYTANCKKVNFDTIDEYSEKLIQLYS